MILPRRIAGLHEVMDDYDGVILDLWGVVHNGYHPFPDAVGALQSLRSRGKAIGLLSNAPRRCADVAAQLHHMGIDAQMYDALLTSGEAVHRALSDELVMQWGSRCYALGAAEGLLSGTGARMVADISDADFVLATSVPHGSLAANQTVLSQAAARRLPFVCANPDRVVYVGENLLVCPGTLADAYEKLGGEVHWFGKPYPAVYRSLLEEMQVRRVLAIGDGLPTDVAGAVTAGIDVALVMAGIHRSALFPAGITESDVRADTPLDCRRLEVLLTAEKVKPSFIIHGLAW